MELRARSMDAVQRCVSRLEVIAGFGRAGTQRMPVVLGLRGDRASWITLLAGADFARSVVGLNSGGGGSQQFNSTVRRFGSGSRFGADAMETC